MSLEEKVKEERLQLLTDMWNLAKENENKAKEQRLKTELEIESFVADKLSVKGTYTCETNLQLTTGESESWSQVEVTKLKNKFDEGELTDIPFFPFDIEYKPNNAKIKLLKEENEKLFFKTFGDALTTKSKKVAFKMKEVKNK